MSENLFVVMQNKHNQIYLTIFILLAIFSGHIFASDKPVWAYNYFSEFNATRFIENKGQLTDSDGKIRNDIRFYMTTGNATVYFLDKSLIFSFSKSNKPISKSADDQTFDVEYSNLNLNFVNSADKPEIIFRDPTDDYLNFYYPHCPDGITYVKSYRKIIYRNLYRGIDLIFYATGDKFGFKYDFIVHKGGNVNDIKLRYENADKLEPISDGSVSIRTNSFQITEITPYTYQFKAGKELRERVDSN